MAEVRVIQCDGEDCAEGPHEAKSYKLSAWVLENGKWVPLVPPGTVTDECPVKVAQVLEPAVDFWNEHHRPDNTGATPAPVKKSVKPRKPWKESAPQLPTPQQPAAAPAAVKASPATLDFSDEDLPVGGDTFPQLCDQPAADGDGLCLRRLAAAQGKGKHLSAAHQIPGTSPAVVKRREEKLRKAG